MRKKRLLLNTVSGLFNLIITLVCGFILPRQILLTYGSDVNGLVSSITQFLGFITMMDMGVGAVVESSLYKPLAENNVDKISELLAAARNFFRRISYILIGYTVILSVAFSFAFSESFDWISTCLLVIAISISSIAQYYFGITNHLLLRADQKAYIPLSMQGIATILNTAFGVLLMTRGFSIQVVKFVSSIVLLIKPFGLMLYVHKHYDIDYKATEKKDTLKQKWDGLAQHIATFVVDRTDIIVLTLLSTLQSVSIYNIYHLVVAGIYQGYTVVTTGVQSLFGNIYAKKEEKTLLNVYSSFELLSHFLCTVLFTCAGVLFVPFVKVYTSGVSDAEAYIQPIFGWLLSIAYACYALRAYYHLIIKAAGKYKETRNGAIIEAVINVVVSVVLVKRFGLIGIAIGTLVAMCYRMVYFIIYINKDILTDTAKKSLFVLGFDIILGCLVFFTTSRFPSVNVTGYLSWGVLAIKVFTSAVIEGIFILIIFFRSNVSGIVTLIRRKGKA